MLLAGKRKYTHKTFCEKCQALKDLEIGESNKNIAAKYNLPKNTLSTWVKNKEKLFDALKKGTNVKTQKMKSGNHDSGFMEIIYHSRLFLGSQNLSHQIRLMRGQ